jgi:2,3-bisphosphoglycerate-independent phosphoglycerate mutase
MHAPDRMARKQKRKRQPMVINRQGGYRFQTGMITADLLRRGLRMADAQEIARAVRDSVAGKKEITVEKLRARVDALIEKQLGSDAAQYASILPETGAVPLVESARGLFPFSKGVVLRHLDTSGLELEDAMTFVARLDQWVRARGEEPLTSEFIHEQVVGMLRASHGEDYARRYRLTSWSQQSDKPIIILLGGATGVGKSTLAMELAYRLGLVWVVSTDMIRETMRTVISPELAPGLHDHSFRGIVDVGDVLNDPRKRVLAGFHRQASQVRVGVRAVIQRAISENAHIIIEGTHLAPPFRQYLADPEAAHLAGFLLAVPDEKNHRKRFPTRANQQNQRKAHTYLDAFQSVRWVHDDLLRIAEDVEAVVLGNRDLEDTLAGAVDFLSRELPVDEATPAVEALEVQPTEPAPPTLLVIIDGMSDEPNPALGDKTPLAAAHTPTLRRLAHSGGQGQVATCDPEGDPPATDAGILALLGDGLDREAKLGRGIFEALGQGLPIPPGSVMFRGNIATVEHDGAITDRRAGRIRAGVEDLLAGLHNVPLVGGVTGRIFPGHEHRVVVMLQGPGLSAAVTDTDPGDEARVHRAAEPRALDESPEAGRTAEALRDLLAKAAAVLGEHPLNASRLEQGLPAANAILTRGASMASTRRTPKHRSLGVMVSGCSTALGVARYIGMQTATSQQLTGSLDTDLDAKFGIAAKLLEEVDFVSVHIKGTDIAAHDRRPLEKRDFISAIDAALGRFLEDLGEDDAGLRVVVSADHGTSSLSGNHIATPVPLLLAQWDSDSDDEQAFDEESAALGALGLLQSGELAQLLGVSRGG